MPFADSKYPSVAKCRQPHTPGPWFCHYATAVAEQAEDDWNDATGITDTTEEQYARTGSRGNLVALIPHDTRHHANAALIAAAPELLAVCQRLLAWQCEDDPYACDDWMELATDLGAAAGRAIAKAEGRSE